MWQEPGGSSAFARRSVCKKASNGRRGGTGSMVTCRDERGDCSSLVVAKMGVVKDGT